MKKRIAALAAATALVCAAAFLLQTALEQRALAEKIIRLHVVAASDTVEDQAVKLRVRDSLLPVIAQATADCGSAAEAEQALRAAIPALTEAARAAAPGEEISVTLAEEDFPRRLYDTFSLPAGRYTALRVTLGPGQGHNWWCVAFPALCLPATGEETEQTAVSAGFGREERELMRDDSPRVELKFRCLEWLRSVFK